jgi:hypothetical protein
MIDYAAILTRRYQKEVWILNGDDYTDLTWLSGTDKPSKATLDGLWESVQSEIAKQQADKQAVLTKLGLTADEVTALLS